MEVTKEQIAKGVSKYIQEDMIPHITDNGMQLLLGIVAGAVETKPTVLDKFLENEMVSVFAKIGNGYDVDVIKKIAVSAMNKYGKLEITIPGIKFISPNEKILNFSADDILRLAERIEGR